MSDSDITAYVNVRPTIAASTPASRCGAGAVTINATPSAGATIDWYAAATGGSPLQSGSTAYTPSITTTTTYYAQARNTTTSCVSTSRTAVTATVTACCHAPGVTATMQNFNPCSNAATNSTWNLTDTRNNVTYRVRLLADGRYWMVDDMKYPTACNKTSFSGASSAGSAGKNGISGFIGDCNNIKNSSTPAARGYLYDWMFVMQHTDAYFGGSWNPGCTGNPGDKAACRGICPEGWHVPTGNPSTGEFTLLNNAVNGGSLTSRSGLLNTSTFNGVYGGYSINTGPLYYQGDGAYYMTSTYYDAYNVYYMYFGSAGVGPSVWDGDKYNGGTIRCIRNY